jgi:hypothetical protein
MTQQTAAALMRARVRELQDYEQAAESEIDPDPFPWSRQDDRDPERIIVRGSVAEIGEGRTRLRARPLPNEARQGPLTLRIGVRNA